MIIYKNKRYVKCNLFPNSDWIGNADWILDDETDSELESKIIGLYPNFDFVFGEDGKPVDVVATEPAQIPGPAPTDHERLEALEAMFSDIGALSLLGGIKMSNFYVLQVKSGRISIDDVPLRWREQVRKEIENDE